MGYFSELDMELRYCEDEMVTESLEVLERQREFLQDRLVEMDEIRPFDSMDPLYDVYFYSDHIAETWELPDTVQGVLESIRLIDQEIENIKAQRAYRIEFLSAVLNTGATPDGQIVLSAKMFPVEEVWQTAA